jgi:hypothetical protein
MPYTESMPETPGGEGEEQPRVTAAEIEDVMMLARRHVPRAVSRLVELMELGGRQSQTACIACKTIVDIAYPDMDAERVKALVETRLKEMIAEAEARRNGQAKLTG